MALFRTKKPLQRLLQDLSLSTTAVAAHVARQDSGEPADDPFALLRRIRTLGSVVRTINYLQLNGIAHVFLRANVMGAWAKELQSLLGIAAYDHAFTEALRSTVAARHPNDTETVRQHLDYFLETRNRCTEALESAILADSPVFAAANQHRIAIAAMAEALDPRGSDEHVVPFLSMLNGLIAMVVIEYRKQFKIQQ